MTPKLRFALGHVENKVGKGENAGYLPLQVFHPLPHMPILSSSNSTTKKDVMSKIWTNGNTFI